MQLGRRMLVVCMQQRKLRDWMKQLPNDISGLVTPQQQFSDLPDKAHALADERLTGRCTAFRSCSLASRCITLLQLTCTRSARRNPSRVGLRAVIMPGCLQANADCVAAMIASAQGTHLEVAAWPTCSQSCANEAAAGYFLVQLDGRQN